MIFAKWAFVIKVRKFPDFAFVFGGQNQENPFKNRIQKRVVFNHQIWKVFPLILGAFWSPKIIVKSYIFEKIDVRRRPLKHYRFRAAFRMDFEPIGIQVWKIFEPPEAVFGVPHRIWRDMCEAFQVEELALMIRATRGRSMDPWICCWSCC